MFVQWLHLVSTLPVVFRAPNTETFRIAQIFIYPCIYLFILRGCIFVRKSRNMYFWKRGCRHPRSLPRWVSTSKESHTLLTGPPRHRSEKRKPLLLIFTIAVPRSKDCVKLSNQLENRQSASCLHVLSVRGWPCDAISGVLAWLETIFGWTEIGMILKWKHISVDGLMSLGGCLTERLSLSVI